MHTWWPIKDLSSFFHSPATLCINALWPTAVSWAMYYTLFTTQFWLNEHSLYPHPLQGQALVTSSGLHAASVPFVYVEAKLTLCFCNQNQICSNFHMISLNLLLFFCQSTTLSSITVSDITSFKFSIPDMTMKV